MFFEHCIKFCQQNPKLHSREWLYFCVYAFYIQEKCLQRYGRFIDELEICIRALWKVTVRWCCNVHHQTRTIYLVSRLDSFILITIYNGHWLGWNSTPFRCTVCECTKLNLLHQDKLNVSPLCAWLPMSLELAFLSFFQTKFLVEGWNIRQIPSFISAPPFCDANLCKSQELSSSKS